MRGWIWLLALPAIVGLSIHYADAIKCLVCSSDEKLKKLGQNNKESLYSSKCLNPDDNKWREKADNPYAWDCEEYDEKMAKIITKWQTASGKGATPVATPPKGKTGCANYSVCRSMYYEADLEYKTLNKIENYRMTGDKRHAFRFCGCLYSPDHKPQDQLIQKEFGSKATICKDTPEGKVEKRRCHCNPMHKSFNGKPCNSAYEIRPHSIYTVIFLVTSWSLIRNHLYISI